MNEILTTFLILYVFSKTVNSDDDFRCDPTVTDYETGALVTDLKEYCSKTPCIYKRCPPNNILFRLANYTACKTLEDINKLSNGTLNFSTVNAVYKFDGNLTEILSNHIMTDFKFLNLNNITSSNCEYRGWTRSDEESTYFVLENGSLLIEYPNHSPRYSIIPAGGYVFEFFVNQDSNTGTFTDPMFIMQTIEMLNDDYIFAHINGVGMLISCFFMVLFLIVFSVLPSLRTLANQILMTYVASLLVAFLLTAMHSLDRVLMNYPYFCEITSVIQYFALLSSYFWMNVIAYDIFWAIRANYKLHPTNRRGINHKYCMYCLYAFGIPFLMTAFALLIDLLDLSNARDIVKIDFSSCLRSVDAVNMYIYTPVAIVIAINVILFLLTVFNIWRVRRALHTTGDIHVKRNENRFFVYFKLSVITGVHWILDITMAFADVPRWIDYISSVYNVLIGVIIFILYICKKRYLRDICKRFSIGRSLIKRIDRKKSHNSTVISRNGTEKSTRTDQTDPESSVLSTNVTSTNTELEKSKISS